MAKKQTTPQFPPFLKGEFTNWAIRRLSKDTVANYCTYLNQLPTYLQGASLGNHKKPRFLNDYLDLIDAFVQAGDRLYALSIYDKIYEVVRAAKQYCQESDKANWNNRHSAMVALGNFLTEYGYIPSNCLPENIDKLRMKISKSDLKKEDGMYALLSAMKPDIFIKMAVESSYFFDPDLVDKTPTNLHQARFTEDPTINIQGAKKGVTDVTYTINGLNFPSVSVDKDGNDFVRKLINAKTGVTVSQGQNSLIQNAIISHVWGQAYDPRYFTSLWNIVLIPAWANSLMDKEEAVPGSLASKMRATYMAICSELYAKTFNDPNKLNSINLTKPQIKNPNDVIHGVYVINVIQESPNPKKIVHISKTTITI
jgi:hypothetical protein